MKIELSIKILEVNDIAKKFINPIYERFQSLHFLLCVL